MLKLVNILNQVRERDGLRKKKKRANLIFDIKKYFNSKNIILLVKIKKYLYFNEDNNNFKISNVF